MRSGSNTGTVKLKNPRGAVATSGAHWLGGAPTGGSTNHEWYNNNYDHNHGAITSSSGPTSGPTSDISDNQLMWSGDAPDSSGPRGSFKPGYANTPTTITNDNPYIDYTVYLNNGYSNNNYSSKQIRGETWNRSTPAWYSDATTKTVSGKYKWILLEDSNNPNFNSTTFTGVEVYINDDSLSGSSKLTLGTDYIMYICMEGDFFRNPALPYFTQIYNFTDNIGTTRYRTGWLDCQRRKSGTTNVTNGGGCFDGLDASNVVEGYKFYLESFSSADGATWSHSSATPTTGTKSINKIFYRIGLKNADGGARKVIKDIYIKYITI